MNIDEHDKLLKEPSTCYIKFSYDVFCSCCKMWTSTDVCLFSFSLMKFVVFFVVVFFFIDCFHPNKNVAVTLSSDAMEPQLFFLCSSRVYKYIYSVYLYMYESKYKYIYIVDIRISIRMCTVWEGLLCIYCYVRIAAKAKQMGWHYKILCFNGSSFITSLHFILF